MAARRDSKKQIPKEHFSQFAGLVQLLIALRLRAASVSDLPNIPSALRSRLSFFVRRHAHLLCSPLHRRYAQRTPANQVATKAMTYQVRGLPCRGARASSLVHCRVKFVVTTTYRTISTPSFQLLCLLWPSNTGFRLNDHGLGTGNLPEFLKCSAHGRSQRIPAYSQIVPESLSVAENRPSPLGTAKKAAVRMSPCPCLDRRLRPARSKTVR